MIEYRRLTNEAFGETAPEGFARRLFEPGCEAAREQGAELLYVSAHSSEGSQAAYSAFGCVHAEEPCERPVVLGSCDVQPEYRLHPADDRTERILSKLIEQYEPVGAILYGSFADGSWGEHSDFDALLITKDRRGHDAGFIDGVQLDVFLYPVEALRADPAPEEFVQVYDGRIVLDRDGTAAALKQRVRAYIDGLPEKTPDELRTEVEWCEKMLARTRRGDAEGFFRLHWLLVDSLEICFDLLGMRYFGPKKALRTLERVEPEGFVRYDRALRQADPDALTVWVEYLKGLAETRQAG